MWARIPWVSMHADASHAFVLQMDRQGRRIAPVMGGQGRHGAGKQATVKADLDILELAARDIESGLTSKDSSEALEKAVHLNAAYQQYLHKMVVERNEESLRPWADSPETEVHCCNTSQVLVTPQLL